MNLASLTSKAKALVARRGGTESVKEDAAELRDIAKGPGGASDKAKAAFEAVKEPGAPGGEPGTAGREPGAPDDAPRGTPGA